MNLLHQLFRRCGIEVLPALVEFDKAVPLVKISCEECMNIFVATVLHIMAPRLVSADQVRDACLRLVK